MLDITIRFYAELNDFLPTRRRQRTIEQRLSEPASVKHVIEALGVPHTQVDLILANGESVDFGYRVGHGDRISVYPVFESIDLTPILRVRPRPLREPRFVLDAHLGKLATYLRMLGFDTLYRNDYDDQTLAQISSQEHRILLTQDRGLLKRSLITHGYYVWESDPEQQLAEVIRRFDLARSIEPFRRCLRCNGVLEPVSKADVLDRLLPKTRLYYEEFARCPACDRVFWNGSHHQRMQRLIDRLRGSAADDSDR